MFLALFGLSLSLISFASISGTFDVSVGSAAQTQQPIIYNSKVSGAHFNQVGDSLSRFFEIEDITFGGSTLGPSRYIRPSSTDSISNGLVYIITGLISGHVYRITAHQVLYQKI